MPPKTTRSRRPENVARGERLKRARLAAGYKSASAAASALAWNRNTYASNENGNAAFSFRRAAEYAKAFGVPALWLYAGEGGPGGASGPEVRRPKGLPGPIDIAIVGEVTANGDCKLEPLAVATALGVLGLEHVYLRVGLAGLADVAPAAALIAFQAGEAEATPDLADQLVVAGLDDGSVAVGRLARGAGGVVLAGRQLAVTWAQPVDAIIMPQLAREITRPLDAPP